MQVIDNIVQGKWSITLHENGANFASSRSPDAHRNTASASDERGKSTNALDVQLLVFPKAARHQRPNPL
jgi:hypothetical protein